VKEILSIEFDDLVERFVVLSRQRRILVQVDEDLLLVNPELVGIADSSDGLYSSIAEGIASDDSWCVDPTETAIYLVQGSLLRKIRLDLSDTVEQQLQGLPEGVYGLSCAQDGRHLLYQSFVPVDPDFEGLKLYMLDGSSGTKLIELPLEFEAPAATAATESGFLVLDESETTLFRVDLKGATETLFSPGEDQPSPDGVALCAERGRVSAWFNDESAMRTRLTWFDLPAKPDGPGRLQLPDIICEDISWHAGKDVFVCLAEDNDGYQIYLYHEDGTLIDALPLPEDFIGVGLGLFDDMVVVAGPRAISVWEMPAF